MRGVKKLIRGYRSFGPTRAAATAYERIAFERDRRERRRKYPTFEMPSPPPAVVADLERDGFAIVRSAVAPELLSSLAAEFDECLRRGEHLNPPLNDAARAAGDLAETTEKIPPEVVAKGVDAFRHLTNYASVDEPFLRCPSSVDLALAPAIVDIAAGYLQSPPAIGGLNLRRSFVNDLTEFDTLHFHCDPNSPKFLKFFFYLNDVDEDGGPFAYVRGSHRRKFRGWRRKYRWTHEEIAERFGEDRITYAVANVGDLVIANTTGFHRGTKVRSRDRSMLTVNYVVHPEFRGRQQPFRISAGRLDAIEESLRPVTDFLQPTDTAAP